MRTPAILVAVLLGTTVSSYAQVKRESTPAREESGTGRFRLDERPAPRKRTAAPRRLDGWAELADATPTKFGTVYVIVGGERTGSFGVLRVDALKGKVAIRRLRVYFTDGTDKVYAVPVMLDQKRHKSTFIDLGGAKSIDRIVVTTVGSVRGEYMLYASEVAKTTCC